MGKRVIMGFLLVLSMVIFAYAQDENQTAGDVFSKASEYLKTNNATITTNPVQGFEQGFLLVKAEGLPLPASRSAAQKRLTALRAAKVLAYRELAEIIKGVAVAGDTTVDNLELTSDRVRVAVEGIIKGAQVVSEDWDPQTETAQVLMKIGMNGPGSLGEALYTKIKDPQLAKTDPQLAQEIKTPAPPFKAKVEKLPETYDGLIIDATDQNFKPALINRIYSSKGTVIYDPTKISQKVLVEEGCGEYTNSVEKAKAALGARGVQNPLVIKATGTPSSTDLQVSEPDSVEIYSANSKSAFLASAKVAFVLK